MEIKGPARHQTPLASAELVNSDKPQQIKSTLENWKTNQILKAIVIESSPQQTRLNIQGILTQMATPAKLELQAGQQLILQVIRQATSKNSTPDLKLLSIDKPVQQIVTEQLRVHLPKQQSLTQLLAEIKAISTQSKMQRLLPAEVIKQVNKFLAAIPEAKQLKNPAALKQALQYSGLFLEQNISYARQADTGNNIEQDLRAILLRLATLLRSSLDKSSTPLPATLQTPLANNLANTLQRHTPHAQATVAARLTDIASAEQLKLQIIKQIESSLARLQSLQLTSVKTDDTSNPLWAIELPVRNQASLDLFDIRLQQEQQNNENDPAKHRWSLSLAFDLDGLGPVHVRVSWFNEKISAIFWVKQQDTQQIFSQHLQTLQQRLLKAGLDIEQINIQQGEPEINTNSNWRRILDEKV